MSRTEDSDFSQGDPPTSTLAASSAQGDDLFPAADQISLCSDNRNNKREKNRGVVFKKTEEPLHPSTSTEDSQCKRPVQRKPSIESKCLRKGIESLLARQERSNWTEEEGDGEKAHTATLFDLRMQDRLRVGKLLEELAQTTDVVDSLKKQMEANKARFRKRKSDLMKKCDALGEKCEMLKTEKQQLQDKYLAALRNLEDNVTTISEQFECSVKEIRDLREENDKMKTENNKLEEKSHTLEEKLEAAKQETKRLGSLLKSAKSKQKILKEEARLLVDSSTSRDSLHQLSERNKNSMENSTSNTSVVVNGFSQTEITGPASAAYEGGLRGAAQQSRVMRNEEEEMLHDLFFIF